MTKSSIKVWPGHGPKAVIRSLAQDRAFSIDRALHLIETGNTGDLAPHSASLMLSLLPLLELGDGVLQLGLDPVNRDLHERLSAGHGGDKKFQNETSYC